MLTCKDTTELVSQSQDRRLSLRERIAVQLHLVICTACRRMVRQMEIIRGISQQIRAPEDDASSPRGQRLSKEAVARIASRLRQAGDQRSGQD